MEEKKNSNDWRAVERTVFDMDDFTIDLAVNEIAKDEDMTEDEVREKYHEAYLMEYATDLEDRERETAILDLRDWFDFRRGGLTNNPNAGNKVLARGFVESWETGSGMFLFPDLGSLFGFEGSLELNLEEFEATRIFDANGALHLQGIQQGGDVDLEVRQLSEKGEQLIESIDSFGELRIPEDGINAMGKVYAEGMEDELIADLWEDSALCPVPRYQERTLGDFVFEFEREIDGKTQTVAIEERPIYPGYPLFFVHFVVEDCILSSALPWKTLDKAMEVCKEIYGIEFED